MHARISEMYFNYGVIWWSTSAMRANSTRLTSPMHNSNIDYSTHPSKKIVRLRGRCSYQSNSGISLSLVSTLANQWNEAYNAMLILNHTELDESIRTLDEKSHNLAFIRRFINLFGRFFLRINIYSVLLPPTPLKIFPLNISLKINFNISVKG